MYLNIKTFSIKLVKRQLAFNAIKMYGFIKLLKGYKRFKTEETGCDAFGKDRKIPQHQIEFILEVMGKYPEISKSELIRFLSELYFGQQPDTDLRGRDKLDPTTRQNLMDMLGAAARKEFTLTFHLICGMISIEN